MGGLDIRAAEQQDLTSIAEIYAHYVTETVVTFDLDVPAVHDWRDKLTALTALGWPFRVGVVDGVVLGYAYVAPWRVKPAYRLTLEDSVYVAPDHIGQGYGRALLRDLLVEARTAGARQLVAVIADAGTDTSVRLHRSLGFVDAGRLHGVGFKHGRWVDVTLMQASL